MLDTVFVNHVWVAIGVWTLLYCSDYALTLAAARLYRSGVDKHFVFKHLELTPYYQEDIAQLRKFSPRFVLMLVVSCGAIWAAGSLQVFNVRLFSWWPDFSKNFYRVLLGALLLMEMAIHVRHFRNLGLFAYARRSRGIQGRVIYSPWLSYRFSAIELCSFAVVFLVSFLITSNWFFIGGTTKCLVDAAKHWRLSGREPAFSVVPETAPVEGHASTQSAGTAPKGG